MAVLVRWRSEDGVVTLRASASEPHPHLPNHLRLVEVRGVGDPEYPDLQVHALNIRKEDIEFMCEAREIQQPAAPTAATKGRPPPPPKR